MTFIVTFCLSRRVMVLLLLAVFLGAAGYAFTQLNIEAYPNPAPPIFEIVTQNRGQSPEEVERYITIPIELAIAGTPGLQYVRSTSLYGLSFVRAQFTYETEFQFAYQQVLNNLNNVALPAGIQPQVAPNLPTGEILRYQLVGPPGMSSTELRTLQDWVVTRRMKTVPGVRDVVSWGGPTKEYHAEIDLNRLPAYNVTLPQVITAISNSNINVGGRTLQIGQQSANVRGIGLIYSVDDIKNIVLSQSNGTPVLVGDVAKVSVGSAPRLGRASRDGEDDVVTGIVLLRRGEKTMEVIKRVEEQVEKINATNLLPPGVRMVPYYDRADLVNITIRTVVHNLTFGVSLIFVILWLFLGNLRSAIIVACTIPVALGFATIILVLRGESINLLSVGAIDLGIIVDSTVIMVENIYRRLADHRGPGHEEEQDAAPLVRGLASLLPPKLQTILSAAGQVNGAIFFSVLITIAAFIPLFTMQGVEGQIFGPMSKTYAFALCGALLATFIVTPVVSSLVLPEKVRETETFVVRAIRAAYEPVLHLALRFRWLTIAAAIGFLMFTGIAARQLGSEFLPKLEEGNLWIRATLPPTISLEAGETTVARIRAILKSFPEVVTVVSQHGRPDDGSDPAGFNNGEFFASLKPTEEWRQGLTKAALVKSIQDKLSAEIIGVDLNFSQNIQDNVEEAVSGVKGENSIKLFGPDLKVLDDKAREIETQIKGVKGIEDLGVLRELGQPNVVINIDRALAARYGFAAGDVNAVVQAAIGGQTATTVYEGERQFGLTVRLLPEYRNNLDAIRKIQVSAAPASGGGGAAASQTGNPVLAGPTASPTALNSATTAPGGGTGQQNQAYVPLSDVAKITYEVGASYIYRENFERYIPLKFSVRGRDLGSTVGDAQAKVKASIGLPTGYRTEWTGEFGSLQEAQRRLAFIVPVSIGLILMLLYSLFNSLPLALLAISAIPFAMCGGILALHAAGHAFSISAAVGFISLFGVSVMDSIMLLSFYVGLRGRGLERDEALQSAAKARLPQIMTTSLCACIGLLPAALSTAIGSQVQAPLATVVVGGMLISPFLTLLFVPVIGTVVLKK